MWTRKPPKPSDLLARMRWAEDRLAATDRLFHLGDVIRGMQDWDGALATHAKRKRGQKAKLQGGQAVEEEAVNVMKRLKDLLKQDGWPTFEAWEKARQQVAEVINVKPATLEDWQRGVNKRQRHMPIEKRRHRRRVAKSGTGKRD